MSKNYQSPVQSPREESNINGSTYALQVALRNMKERYHKLQRKLAFIEEENQRLLNGKTELFGEIGVIQESGIKLREKNLQLNQEIHSKHQENCSLRESYNALSHQNMNLARDNRKLHTQVNQLTEDNKVLQQQLGLQIDESEMEECSPSHEADVNDSRLSPDSITPALPTSDIDEDSMDSLKNSEGSLRYSSLFGGSEDASDRMDIIMDEVQRQNLTLRKLLPLLTMYNDELSPGTLLSQRDRDLSTVTVAATNRLVNGGDTSDSDGLSSDQSGNIVPDRPTLLPLPLQEQTITKSPTHDISPGSSPSEVSPLTSPISGDGVGRVGWSGYLTGYNLFGGRQQNVGLNSPPAMQTTPSSHQLLYPGATIHEDSKICPMCNQVFSREVTQDMFENHVVAHFEDVDVSFEVVSPDSVEDVWPISSQVKP